MSDTTDTTDTTVLGSASDYEMGEPDSGDWVRGTVNVLAGAAVGVIIGGALGLLFAPKPGVDLRADLGNAADDWKDRAEQTLDDLQASASDLVARSRATLEQTRENLVRSVEAGREAYTQKRDELTARLDADLPPPAA